MIRKLLTLCACSLAAFNAQAARYLTISFESYLHFDINVDTALVDAYGLSTVNGDGFWADYQAGSIALMGSQDVPPGFNIYMGGVDFPSLDLTPSSFHYFKSMPSSGWFADYYYYIDQYQFPGTIHGNYRNLHVIGTETPLTPGITVSGVLPVPTLPVPESATWMMMVAGFGLVGWGARRRSPTLNMH